MKFVTLITLNGEEREVPEDHVERLLAKGFKKPEPKTAPKKSSKKSEK